MKPHPIIIPLIVFICCLIIAVVMWCVNIPNFEYEKENAFRYELTGSVMYE